LLPAGGNDDHAVSSSATVPQHVPSDLILMVTSDILQSLLCSYHDTTSPEHFQLFIGALANRYRALLSLLRSSTPFVLENTALLLHLLSTHAPSSTAAIRDAALSSGVLLQHFYLATFSPLEGQRFLSRYLCSMWLSGPPNCDEKRLLKRMVPHGFLAFLNMPPLSRMEEDQLDVLERDIIEGNVTDLGAAAAATEALAASTIPGAAFLVRYTQDSTMVAAGGTNTARLRSRMALASNTSVHMGQTIPKENFRIFFHVLTQDHSMADLIWNQQTRRELRIALESELEYVRRETEARGIHAIAWNHQQFHVKFPSLDNEVKVGDVYMRLWLQAGDGFIRSWDEPVRLFEHLFRRFLCEVDRDEKVSFFVTVGKWE
jgi:DnaJ homolog subfamily C member 13